MHLNVTGVGFENVWSFDAKGPEHVEAVLLKAIKHSGRQVGCWCLALTPSHLALDYVFDCIIHSKPPW